MIFASLDWWIMVANTLDALFAEEHIVPTIDLIANLCFRAREGGQNAEQLRAYLQSLPVPTPPAPPASTLPPIPSREKVCSVQLTFQGLTAALFELGPTPWFEPFLASLDAVMRQDVYQVKRAAGDTHCFLSLAYNYVEADYRYPLSGRDFTNPGWMDEFLAITTEVIQYGFIPVISLSADGQGYNPEGGTHGWQWGMDRMVNFLDAFRHAPAGDLTPYCLWMGGYELLGPGGSWSPEQLEAFYLQLRSLLPHGHLALELGGGYNHWGGGVKDWTSPAGQAIDVFLQEFPQPIDGGTNWDGCQQLAARMLGPAKRNIEPKNDGPWYLASGTPRGPFFVCAFEFDLYRFVRGQMTSTQVADERMRLRTLGYTLLG